MSRMHQRHFFWLLIGVACAGLASGQAGRTRSSATAPAAKPLDVVYLFSPTCLKCRQASKLIDAAAGRYGLRICVQRLNVQDANDLERVLALEERCHAAAAAPPRVFIGSRCLTGLDSIAAQLDATISQELKALAARPSDSQPSTRPASQASLTRPGMPM